MVRQSLKILQHLLQDFQSVSGHFGKLCLKGLNYYMMIGLPIYIMRNAIIHSETNSGQRTSMLNITSKIVQ